jgi:sporulation protein YlmC with PRC-barrel domain
MRLELGRRVRCTDGPCGELADVVVDPADRRITHLVVAPHHRYGAARLVPAALAVPDDGDPGGIALRCTADDLRGLEAIDEFASLRLGEVPLNDPDGDVGVQNVIAEPFLEGSEFAPAAAIDPRVALRYDRIPKGEVEIRRASDVVSVDGHRLGAVDGFLIDGDDAVTHVVLERGHLFGRREVTIPVEAVRRVETDEVSLALTKDEVERLPAARVHRWSEWAARRRPDDVDER